MLMSHVIIAPLMSSDSHNNTCEGLWSQLAVEEHLPQWGSQLCVITWGLIPELCVEAGMLAYPCKNIYSLQISSAETADRGAHSLSKLTQFYTIISFGSQGI